MSSRIVIVSCFVATLAFVTYSRTLLQGVDLGDTGGFQAAVLWPETSARQAYPLYYALARPFVSTLSPANPARGLNLFSAFWAAIAVGALAAAVALVTESLSGGAVAGLLLAFSYTFWTQAVIAEVYSLHLALVAICLLALVAWSVRPTNARLALFFAIYAIGFGNHLSMILLLVPFAIFLFASADHRADLIQPRVIALAIGIAVVGSLQYVTDLQAIWFSLDAPERWTDRVAAFWFDVTKADWRESMVLSVRASQMADRAAMFVFDARQQFGIAGLALALAGAAALWRISRPWALLVLSAYAINTAFAITYNVGDPHVFFLPGHFFVAFAAGAAVAAAARMFATRRAIALTMCGAALAYAGWRGYDTWPAADRHADRRAEQLITGLTLGLDERRELLVAQVNWQIENALLYETRYRLPQIVWTRLSDVLFHFPLLVRDNHAGQRDVVLTATAADDVSQAFGSLLPVIPDPTPTSPTLARYVERLPRGAPYVLTILRPNREETLNEDQVGEVLKALTGGRIDRRTGEAYEVMVGNVGGVPKFRHSAARPFRERLSLSEGKLDIRMDGFVPAETFRRGGFGHVILGRQPILTVERGVSLVTLDGGAPAYAASLYAPQPRFRIPSGGLPELALLH